MVMLRTKLNHTDSALSTHNLNMHAKHEHTFRIRQNHKIVFSAE